MFPRDFDLDLDSEPLDFEIDLFSFFFLPVDYCLLSLIWE
mgnify:CR=1 FL=1